MNRRLVIFACVFSPLAWAALAAAVLASCASAWPEKRETWVPRGTPRPPSSWEVTASRCCGSMRPTLVGGETLRVARPDGRPLVGYIVAIRRPDGGAFLHRVNAENDRAVLTGGDANRNGDGWTEKRWVEYFVLEIVRRS